MERGWVGGLDKSAIQGRCAQAPPAKCRDTPGTHLQHAFLHRRCPSRNPLLPACPWTRGRALQRPWSTRWTRWQVGHVSCRKLAWRGCLNSLKGWRPPRPVGAHAHFPGPSLFFPCAPTPHRPSPSERGRPARDHQRGRAPAHPAALAHDHAQAGGCGLLGSGRWVMVLVRLLVRTLCDLAWPGLAGPQGALRTTSDLSSHPGGTSEAAAPPAPSLTHATHVA